jgi:hypothetical protein
MPHNIEIEEQPLTTVASNDCDDNNEQDNHPPLDSRVIETIRRTKPNYTIRPAKLATELGISIDDASSELCGLLRAVGSSATFRFESIPSDLKLTSKSKGTSCPTVTMVFCFPPDFEKKAYATRRKEDMKEVWWNILYALIKILKVIVAFGLIISLAVVLIGGLCIVLASVVALSRNGGRGGRDHNRRLIGYSRTICSSLRELLWLFSLGRGFDHFDGVDPFLAETAYTLALWRPSSIWFWLRMCSTRRRRRVNRGWSNLNSGVINTKTCSMKSERTSGSGVNTNNSAHVQQSREQEQGLLSISVEFLFGPTPFMPGPSDYFKWKLREQFIIRTLSQQEGAINLLQLIPFVNHPPATLDGTQMRSECLDIVTHFNGIPFMRDSQDLEDIPNMQFIFPELMLSESENLMDDNDTTLNWCSDDLSSKPKEGSQISFLYSSQESIFLTEGHTLGGSGLSNQHSQDGNSAIPKYLYEKHHVLTKLTKSHFQKCIFLNIMNYIGLVMLWKSIHDGGVLEIQDRNSIKYTFVKSMLLMLDFYAKLFFCLPIFRMIIILVLNRNIDIRNARREAFSNTSIID